MEFYPSFKQLSRLIPNTVAGPIAAALLAFPALGDDPPGLFKSRAAGSTAALGAEAPAPIQDFAKVCAADQPDLGQWRVSGGLKRELWAARLTCVADQAADKPRALRLEVRPGDAYDPNPGDNPTERVEIQIRRELVKFEQPIWYSFRFRLAQPWLARQNRTVIHQIKQNIAPDWEISQGGQCPSANPFFKIEAGHRPEAGGAAFVVKTRGTDNCRDGKAGAISCGPWPLEPGRWHRVHVALRASQRDGQSDLRVWLDGRPCAPFTGRLGYTDHGKRDADGKPEIDAQPRFGLYRDALPDAVQVIDFADISFWDADPASHPAWAGIGLKQAP